MSTLDNSRVSRHLGQTSDYANQYDPSLLVREPRQSNRKHLSLKDNNLPFVGYDIWNAWEVSCLTDKGQPITAIGKIVYPCDNEYIVESKSLKLYFNSFNMTKLGRDRKEAYKLMQEYAEKDLSELLETDVKVYMYRPSSIRPSTNTIFKQDHYDTLEDDEDMMDGLDFSVYSEDPTLLRTRLINGHMVRQHYHSSLLKSNCRVTNQPDWGDVFIYIKCNQQVDRASLAKYIVSFRDECHFHEEICETIYKRLWDEYTPHELAVTCLYVRRGGIDINPTRVSEVGLLNMDLIDPDTPFMKTSRQ